jgi:hypothetical protein
MNRTEKIKSLQAILDRRLKPSDLYPPKNYLIIQHEGKGYTIEGKPITENEYRVLADRFKEETCRRENLGLPVGYFITVELVTATL